MHQARDPLVSGPEYAGIKGMFKCNAMHFFKKIKIL